MSAWPVEALPPDEIAAELRAWVGHYTDEGVLARSLKHEAREREQMIETSRGCRTVEAERQVY